VDVNDTLELNKIAFTQALKNLDWQDALIESIRRRAIGISGLTSLTTAFLGKEAMSTVGSTPGIWDFCAIASLVASLITVMYLLSPFSDFETHLDPVEILKNHSYGIDPNLEDFYSTTAEHSEDNFSNNDVILNRMFIAMWLGFFFVGAQIIFWTLSILI